MRRGDEDLVTSILGLKVEGGRDMDKPNLIIWVIGGKARCDFVWDIWDLGSKYEKKNDWS